MMARLLEFSATLGHLGRARSNRTYCCSQGVQSSHRTACVFYVRTFLEAAWKPGGTSPAIKAYHQHVPQHTALLSELSQDSIANLVLTELNLQNSLLFNSVSRLQAVLQGVRLTIAA